MNRRLASITVAAASLLTPLLTHAQTTEAPHDPWWKHAAIYEIYPRSFQDSNGDGVGDLNGITARLDYVQQLGVDTIWIAPMYPSPQVDFGYDISDYEAVDPQYGTLEDFDRLLAAAKQRHIRVVLDFVLNHTSDKHAWFIESTSSRTNAKADWYVWNNGIPADSPGVTEYQKRFVQQTKNGPVVPPNNWISAFGGSAWQWVPARQQFYYHKFCKEQPDLNWNNPKVEKAMFDTMRFWFDRGVAGFRLDAVPTLFEDPQLRNEPELGGVNAHGDPKLKEIYTANLPQVHGVMKRMRALTDSYPGDRVLIGETYLPDTTALIPWYGGKNFDELQLPMDMLLGFPKTNKHRLDATQTRELIVSAATQLPGAQPLFVFDNHDQPRSWDRYADGKHDAEIARMVAALLYTTKSTALTYYGAELGMTTETPKRLEDVRDPAGIIGWPKAKGRDGERTPMQWSAGAQAGFSENTHPWLPIPRNYTVINVETELSDPNSLLNWNRTLLAIRKGNPAMYAGDMTMLDTSNTAVLSYVRSSGKHAVVVSMNMSAEPQTIHLDLSPAGITTTRVRTLLSDDPAQRNLTSVSTITLAPYATLLAEVQ